MISTEYAISRTRRGLTIVSFTRFALIGVAALALLAEPWIASGTFSAMGIVTVVGAVWLFLSFRSAQGSRMVADSPSLIAAGRYEQAEQHIKTAMQSFSIFRTMRLMSLHHLAMLRHAQQRWQESALLSRELLSHRVGEAGTLDRSSRLMLIESLLELNDLTGVQENLSRLYERRLSLREAINLLALQTDYMARVQAWDAMLAGLPSKIQLAELMSGPQSARTQAFLALAAKKVGRDDWWKWLRQRVELLIDVQRLCTQRPILFEVWQI